MGEPLIKLKKNKFEIASDRIAIYTNLQVKVVFYAFAIIMTALILATVYVGLQYNSIGKSMPLIIMNVIMVIVLIVSAQFFSSKKIVFDKLKQEVYSINGPFKKHLINFSDIYDITKSTNSLSGLYYRIQPKTDRIGNGIKISSPYGNTISKEEREFTTEVLPKLKEMVFSTKTSNIVSNSTISNVATNTAFASNTTFANFKTTDNNTYTYAPIISYLYFAIATASFLFFGNYLHVFINESMAEHKVEWGALLGMLLFMGGSVYFMYRNSQKNHHR